MSNENNPSDVTAKDLLNDILAENASNDTPVKNTLAENRSTIYLTTTHL